MRTVITHFYNEEYMLPWWIRHHRPMFDHGILIDYGSTDASAEICRTLAPDWRLVRSRNLKFAALAVDFEVMQYEAELPGWKLALNVSEFLCCDRLDRLEQATATADRTGVWIPAAVMVDPFSEDAPERDRPLVAQKHHGFHETEVNFSKYYYIRRRLYHRAETGAYMVGRHASQLVGQGDADYPALILWYGFSPWRPEFLRRKLQIGSQVPDKEFTAGYGLQHRAAASELERRRAEMLPQAHDLSAQIAALAPAAADSEAAMPAATRSIYEIAADTGALKSPSFWPVYEKFFEPLRHRRLALLELGVYNGGSLRCWEAYFPQAQIAGIDLALPALNVGERVHMYEGNQADPALLSRVAAEVAPEGFDIIIDDCAHIGVVAKASFWHLFDRHLKPGGLYVIEDWGTGYWPTWPDGRAVAAESDTERRLPSHDAGMVGLIKQLIDELAAPDIKEGYAAPEPRQSKFAEIVLQRGLCVITKALL